MSNPYVGKRRSLRNISDLMKRISALEAQDSELAGNVLGVDKDGNIYAYGGDSFVSVGQNTAPGAIQKFANDGTFLDSVTTSQTGIQGPLQMMSDNDYLYFFYTNTAGVLHIEKRNFDLSLVSFSGPIITYSDNPFIGTVARFFSSGINFVGGGIGHIEGGAIWTYWTLANSSGFAAPQYVTSQLRRIDTTTFESLWDYRVFPRRGPGALTEVWVDAFRVGRIINNAKKAILNGGYSIPIGDPYWLDDPFFPGAVQDYDFYGWTAVLDGGPPPFASGELSYFYGSATSVNTSTGGFVQGPQPYFNLNLTTNLRYDRPIAFDGTYIIGIVEPPTRLGVINQSTFAVVSTTPSPNTNNIINIFKALDGHVYVTERIGGRTKTLHKFTVTGGGSISKVGVIELEDRETFTPDDWYRYGKTVKQNIGNFPSEVPGTPFLLESGIIEPVTVSIEYIREMRTRVEALATSGRFQNPATTNDLNWTNASPDNLYFLAMGDRTNYGATGGPRYDWTREINSMVNTPTYDIDIGEIHECVSYLEAL